MSTALQYRVPGYPSQMGLNYVQALTAAGWTEEQVELLLVNLPRFESASILHGMEEALEACISPIPEVHYEFLKKLNSHIRRLTEAELIEELRQKATSGGKDSLPAAQMVVDLMEKGGEVSKQGGTPVLNIKVKSS